MYHIISSSYHKRQMPVVSRQLPAHNYCSGPSLVFSYNIDDRVAYSMLLLLSRLFVLFVWRSVRFCGSLGSNNGRSEVLFAVEQPPA